jgi:ADP-ribose pyrophosphatase YjhB (NUDIX family)
MNFCSHCGQPVVLRIPEGDSRPRFICETCGTIHYQNPRVVTGCLATFEDRVLLARRAIQPRHGFWTLPAGFLENGETAAAGAARETLEEACAAVADLSLYTVFSLPHINQIYTFFRAELKAPEFRAGAESLDVRLMREDEIPWEELAFPVITDTLKFYFDDRRRGHFPARAMDIIRPPRPPRP